MQHHFKLPAFIRDPLTIPSPETNDPILSTPLPVLPGAISLKQRRRVKTLRPLDTVFRKLPILRAATDPWMRRLGLQTRPRSGLKEVPTAVRSPSPTAAGARGPSWTTTAATNRRGNSRFLTARLRPHVFASTYVITHERRIPDAPGPDGLGAGRESG